MSEDASFSDVITRLAGGDQQAAADLFARFASRLVGLARTRLNGQVRKSTDPEDIMQSVWRSFFVRQREGKFDIDNWDALWAILVVITVRKCGRRAGALRAAKRDVSREVTNHGVGESSDHLLDLADREPTPEQAATLRELVERLMDGLEERENRVLAMRLEGHSVAEIANAVGRTQRTVHRVLTQLRRRAEDLEEGSM